MRRKIFYGFLLPVLVLALLAPLSGAPGNSDYPRRPKLVVVLVIDQFRFDYLVRFRLQFVERGFNLLLNGGANFVDCRYDYAVTATGPGHATLFTGAYGDIHGIVDNNWYDRTLHRPIYCVEDPNTNIVGGAQANEPGNSPRNLIGSTISDELRIATNFESRVVSISMKDRAAVLPGGHTANQAYWYDPRNGHFVTSTYYMPSLPAWASQYNDAGPARAYCGKSWQALPETPGIGGRILRPAYIGKEPCPKINFLAWMLGTPFMNEVELNFAREAIKGEHLGQGPATDLLAISLSINDYIGHSFGPYSPEVADTTVRTDRYLADFFADLDKLVGLDNVWIALSADHGVSPNPKFIREYKLGLGLIKADPVTPAVNAAFAKAYAKDHWVESILVNGDLYLDLATLEKHHVSRATAETLAAEAAVTVPGIEAAFTRTQFLTGTLPPTPIARKAAHSFNPRRWGDVMLIGSPYSLAVETQVNTTHGTPWNYDAQVPMVLWGSAFRPGVYATPCQPIDLAATLAVALGVTQPSGTQGRPLAEALK